MKKVGLDACGTIRAGRRGIPPKPCNLPKHGYQVAQKDDLTFCAWQDTKVVMVLSNFHDPTATGKVLRRKGGDRQREVTVPACLADYQKHMKGVDLLDQMVGYYLFNHRSKKWWRRLFFFFLTVSCTTPLWWEGVQVTGRQATRTGWRTWPWSSSQMSA